METNQTTQTTTTQQPITNKKMKACKTCGASIAKSAKKCPSCGAKNKKPPIALIIVLAIILVLGGIFASKIVSAKSSEAILTANGTEYKWSEYRDLYHEYYLNSKTIEFQETFVPATVEASGEITKISDAIIGETIDNHIPTEETLKKYEITLDNGCTYSVIYKYFDESKFDFSHLSVGDKVTVKGTVTKETLFPTNIIKEKLDAQLKITGKANSIVKE